MLKNALNTLKKRKFENDIIHHEENQYLNLIQDILNEGEIVEGRNGKTLAVFGSSMHFSLENNNIPLLTTKKVAWKTCLKELVWFIMVLQIMKFFRSKMLKFGTVMLVEII